MDFLIAGSTDSHLIVASAVVDVHLVELCTGDGERQMGGSTFCKNGLRLDEIEGSSC